MCILETVRKFCATCIQMLGKGFRKLSRVHPRHHKLIYIVAITHLKYVFLFTSKLFRLSFRFVTQKFLVNKFDLLHLKRSFDFNCTLFLHMANGYNYTICFVSIEIMNQNGFFLFWLWCSLLVAFLGSKVNDFF